jgi:transcriptional regulator with XRE-family HTH domain
MKANRKTISNVIKEYRKKNKFSCEYVSALLKQKGIDVNFKTIYGWEAGRSQPDATTLLVLCNIYGIKDILKTFMDNDKIPHESDEKASLLRKIERLDNNSCMVVSAFIDGLQMNNKNKQSLNEDC